MKVVYLTDVGIEYDYALQHFEDVANWAKSHCASFIDYTVQDVSDVSLQYDYVTEYRFHDPKDVMLFTLKWK
jgi:hypothetical protein